MPQGRKKKNHQTEAIVNKDLKNSSHTKKKEIKEKKNQWRMVQQTTDAGSHPGMAILSLAENSGVGTSIMFQGASIGQPLVNPRTV